MIAKFKSRRRPAFVNLLIEIQLWSRIQHAWGTAVETVDLFRGADLKSNRFDRSWRRFFACIATVRSKPVAQLIPPPRPEAPKGSTFGCMAGTAEILGDIVEPLGEDDWEVFRE